MTKHAHGTFEVQMLPQILHNQEAGPLLGRLALTKQFSGDLQAVGEGEMLTATTTVPGSAGYVAIERVMGTLAGRHGSFVLLHTGIMASGAQSLQITVVPDSGTGALTGLAGELLLTFPDGTHAYELVYTLPGLT